MAKYIKIGEAPSKFEWNNAGVTKMFKESESVLKLVTEATLELVEEVKRDIEYNATSSYGKDTYGIQRSASYFANNVRGQIIRTTGRQKGIPLGMVALKADNALAYEAEHGNLQRVLGEYNG